MGTLPQMLYTIQGWWLKSLIHLCHIWDSLFIKPHPLFLLINQPPTWVLYPLHLIRMMEVHLSLGEYILICLQQNRMMYRTMPMPALILRTIMVVGSPMIKSSGHDQSALISSGNWMLRQGNGNGVWSQSDI